MYDLVKIKKHAHIFSVLVISHPKYFSKAVPLPSTHALMTEIFSGLTWKDFAKAENITSEDFKGFISHWKAEIEYATAILVAKCAKKNETTEGACQPTDVIKVTPVVRKRRAK